jgi:hypothetical protein
MYLDEAALYVVARAVSEVVAALVAEAVAIRTTSSTSC